MNIEEGAYLPEKNENLKKVKKMSLDLIICRRPGSNFSLLAQTV